MDDLGVPDVLSVERALLGESPRWDERSGAVFWVDIDRGEVWSAELGGHRSARLAHRAEAPLGALVLHEDGGLLWSVGDSWARPGGGAAQVSLGLPHLRFNDAGVDARGVVWSGTMRRDEDLAATAEGVLYRLGVREASPVLSGLVAGNGIAWSPDDEWMFLVDSGPGTVRRAAFDPATGRVDDWSVWVTVPAGTPDGVAADVDGGLWVACWGAGEVARFDRHGDQTHRLRLPTPAVTAVTFAGPQLDALVCTTSSQDIDPADDPLAGRTFVVPSPIPGTPLHRAVGW